MPLSPELAVFLIVSALAATWVHTDYRSRTDGPLWERIAWWLGTLLALPIFLPIYLVAARPPGRLVRCPSCGRLTLAHRAACRHCGNAIAFEPGPRLWGLSEVAGISLAFILTLALVAQTLGVGPEVSLPELVAFATLQNALFIGLTLYVARIRYRLPAATLGLRAQRWPLWVAGGLIAGALSVPVSTGAEDLAITIIAFFTGRARAEAMAEEEHLRDVLTGILQGPLTAGQIVLIFLLLCALVPVGEELFFRGFVYGALRRWGIPLANVLSAFFFAAVHHQVVHFLPVFLLGIILAWLYERTGSLLPAMLVHALNNAVAILQTLYGWKF
ncbi:MAG: CPBP family glutamic-type intramembrane protease [Armatimonadota bacterium]|nr:CPBP family glutamic-type intramembrane protease [Armatimonadota bacterium]MDR7451000.1 CPBP family glutamic-type intramembrane protease [Armatimonadota bacterium]MDR7465979.1 CPBP family glutamic-type intramembrane protease [Armatimonadota bacterium]MDR7494044.1 CPBP family glutamic-type intramembrane protease [Armatimonadota bacterium]MDR7498494.1 CPBP family glutamic-type intramembrane protease [Armatimonadota bacterium]